MEPPLPAFTVRAYEDTLIDGRYLVKKEEACVILLKHTHRDKEVYGEDADDFRPERMLDENFKNLPRGAFKPFGNGQRACIGRNFALQEANLMLVMLLQNFNLELDDPSYELQFKQTLTIKPKDFKIRASLRGDLTPITLQQRLHHGTQTPSTTTTTRQAHQDSTSVVDMTQLKPLTILYGSNAGTCANLAQLLATHAPSHGFTAVTVECLDTAIERVPKDHPVVFITTSYEGQPTGDAKLFFSWLSRSSAKVLDGVKYAIYGLGHHDWASTFHKVPKVLDAMLEEAGGQRLLPLHLEDVGASDIFSTFETWEDEAFWPMLKEKYGVNKMNLVIYGANDLDTQLHSLQTTTLRHCVSEALVVSSRNLTAPGEPVKKHLEIRLPASMSYQVGDYLLILPMNPHETVQRVLKRFRIPYDPQANGVTGGSGLSSAPKLIEAIESFVELSHPASKRAISVLVDATKNEQVKEKLQQIGSELCSSSQVESKHISILDLLETFPDIELPLNSFLALLPPLKLRQ
jgi:cytochrome P450/NADPH-cytochrome P450 reductase